MEIKQLSKHMAYHEVGRGAAILLIHGLVGRLSNWATVVAHFSTHYRVITPILPIYEGPKEVLSVAGLARYLKDFIEALALEKVSLMGNSLGGHIALAYALDNPDRVQTLVLTGSSGLFENSPGGDFPRRGSYAYIKAQTQHTFYDPNVIDEAFIKEIYETVQNLRATLRIVAIAKSAQHNNMAKSLGQITAPTLLVWGLNDTITPPTVAYAFYRGLPNATIRFADKCSHVPMMEHPDWFNQEVEAFLAQHIVANPHTS